MHDWLTIELVLAALLMTSFTCVGLLALWAATSPRHWFVRAAVVLAVLAPLLLIPAYEPFLVFLLQAGVIASGTKAWQRWSTKSTITDPKSSSDAVVADRPAAMQFSLLTLLLLMAVVAVAVAIAVRIVNGLPPQNRESWLTVVINGVLSGSAVLVGGWIVVAKRKRLVVPIAIVSSLVLAGVFAWQDWFVLSMIQGYWPPDFSNWQQWQQSAWEYAFTLWWRTVAVCVGTIFAVILITCLLVFLWQSGAKARLAVGAILFLTALFPGCILLNLLNPTPIPQVTLPEPNGWHDLVAAGTVIGAGRPILNTAVEPQSTDELAAEVVKFAEAYDQIRIGLARQCQAPIWPPNRKFASTPADLPLDDVQHLRNVARALMREAELAQQQGRYSDAANIAVENLRVGRAGTRGGLLIHYLVGVAIEGMGQHSLYHVIPNLDLSASRAVAMALEDLEKSREPLADVLARDRIWDENAFGWHGHLLVILQIMTNTYGGTNATVLHAILPRTQAINHLLVVELALRQHTFAYGEPPETLDQLVPEFLDHVPVDPFDVDGRPLRYVRSAEGYVAYSVGYDGDDDGGRPPAKDEYGNTDWFGDGDLRLDVWFAPEDEVVDVAAVADAAEADATTHDSE